MDYRQDIQFVIYLVWIFIPTTLFALGCLFRVLLLLGPTPDPETRLRPRRLIRLANLLFLTALAALSFDYFLIQTGKIAPPLSTEAQYYRVAAFPVAAVILLCLSEVMRFAFPAPKYEKMKHEVRGSNPLVTVFAVVFFVFMVGKSNYAKQNRSFYRGSTDVPATKEAEAGQTTGMISMAPSPSKPSQQHSGETSGIRAWLGSIEGFFPFGGGDEREPSSQQTEEYEPPPDFNQEGYLKYREMISQVARELGVEPLLLLSMVQISSGFQAELGSESAEGGLLQLSPDILRTYGFRNVFSPEQNIKAGARYLKDLLEFYDTDVHKALMAFRIGKEKVEKNGALPSDKIGERFVEQVISVYEIASARGSLE